MKRAPSTESSAGEPIKPLPLIVIEPRTPAPEDRSELLRRPAPPPRITSASARRPALDAPVELPVRTKWIPFMIVIAVVLVPIGIVILLYLASRRPMRVLPTRGSRVDLVAPPARDVSAPAVASTVPVLPKRATVPSAKKASKRQTRANKPPKAPVRTEVRSRAAPAGLIQNRTNDRAQ